MTKELITGNRDARVVERTYGDGSVRYWLQTNKNGLVFKDEQVYNDRLRAIDARDEWLLEQAQAWVVSEKVVD